MTDSFGWTPDQISHASVAGARGLSAQGCVLLPREGGPILPFKTVQYRLDPGLQVGSLKVLREEWSPLEGAFRVDDWSNASEEWGADEWTGALRAASEKIEPASWYPSSAVEYAGGGYLRGRRMEGFVVNPIRYRGQGGELEYLSRLEIEIELEPGGGSGLKVGRAVRSAEDEVDALVGALVREGVGPAHRAWMESEGVLIQAGAGIEGGFVPSLLPDLEGSPVEYVIVTNEAMSGEFERLAQWKRSRGVGAVVKTVDWIVANYPNGVDLAETIRFFLRDAYENWGTLWVLLGGDTEVIPIRYAYNRYRAGGDLVATDVYYSCLEGNWNYDGDDKWGEGRTRFDPGDKADLYPELAVGRAPVSNPVEAAVFVDKVTGYEKAPPVGYQNKALFFAEVLFPKPWDGVIEPYLDGAELAERVSSLLPDGFEVTRLYENYTAPEYPGAEPLNRDAVVNELNEGHGIALHVGHGFRTTMSTGPENLHNPDASSLTNGDKTSIVHALNCDAAAVDYTCIGETFVLNPNGGAVAYIGATRVEFPQTARYYQDEFFNLVFGHGVTEIGRALAWARLPFAPSAHYDGNGRWSQFVHILLGDPQMTAWTGVPSRLQVSVPERIEVGQSRLQVSVTDAGDGTPVYGATVVCRKEGEVYAVGFTDTTGVGGVDISPDTPGSVAVTVRGRDYVPLETTVPVVAATSAHVYVEAMSVDDGGAGTEGDGDRFPEKGETVGLILTLVNEGTAGASEIEIAMDLGASPHLELLTDTVRVEGLEPGSSVQAPAFRARVSTGVQDGHRVFGSARVITSGGTTAHRFTMEIGAPIIDVYSTTVDDGAGGDGDGIAEPGETVEVDVSILNSGGGSGASVYALLRSDTGGAQVVADSVHYGHVESGTIAPSEGFSINIGSDPSPSFVLTIHDELGPLMRRAFDLTPPSRPAGVTGVAEETSIRLVWEPALEEDREAYIVYRSLAQGGPYSRITSSLLRSSASYEDRGLLPLTEYFYMVSVQDSSGNESALSAEVPVTTSPPALPGWPQSMDIETSGGITLGDLDGDGDLEVVAAGGEIHAYHHDGEEVIDGDSETITHGVFSSIGGTPSKGFWCTPAVADIDGDGVAEIAANYWDGGLTYLWNGSDGSIEPGWPKASSEFSWSSPAFGDIDGDGEWDVVTGGGTGAVYAWHLDGTEVADGDDNPSTDGVLIDHGGDFSYGSTALADLDGDGADEVIFANRNGQLYAVRGDGSIFPGFPYNTGIAISSTPSVADIDEDGQPEIVLAIGAAPPDARSRLEAIDVFPSVGRKWKVDIIFSQDVNSSPAIGDLDGDGAPDVVVGSGNGMVWALHGADGTPLAGWPVDTGGAIRGSACLADVNGDAYPEVLIGDEESLLHCLDGNGAGLAGFPIRVTGVIRAAPAVWDVNDDGLVDILCQAMDKTVYGWSYEGAFDPATASVPWPTFLHDPRNTSYPGTDISYPTRVADWDIRVDEGVAAMSWRPVGWDGSGRWDVYRTVGEGVAPGADEADGEVNGAAVAAGAHDGGAGGDGAGERAGARSAEVGTSVKSGPALLEGYMHITHLGVLSVAGSSELTFRDPTPGAGKVSYVLALVKDKGTTQLFGPRSVRLEGEPVVPRPRLLWVKPNPFSEAAELTLFLPGEAGRGAGEVTFRVFDAAGRMVARRSWRDLAPGVHGLEWDGTGSRGERLGAGVYFYLLEAGTEKIAGKLMLVR